jgi:hypothetical protein
MISVSDNILIEFDGQWLEPEVSENGIETGTDWTYRPDEQRVHEGIVRSVNHSWRAKNYPNDLKVGDKVRCYYNAIDLAVPYIKVSNTKAIYSVTMHEVLHRINPDGSIDMQNGWVAGEPPPLQIPHGMRMEMINNVPWWVGEATGIAHEKINFGAIKNRMILRYQGEIYVDDWDFEDGDTVLMLKDCEFPNNGHNEIQGKKYWFVRQENIIGKIVES